MHIILKRKLKEATQETSRFTSVNVSFPIFVKTTVALDET